jgi:hypothetical protein
VGSGSRLAVCGLLALTALLGGSVRAGASQTRLSAISSPCPLLAPAALDSIFGGKLDAGDPIHSGYPGNGFQCYWSFSRGSGFNIAFYTGSAEYKTMLAQDTRADAVMNGAMNQSGTSCKPALGVCAGVSYNDHLSPLAGVGQRAFEDPGSYHYGSSVVFIWKGKTYLMQGSPAAFDSPETIRQPTGPKEAQLVSVAKLIIRAE